jgi:hypothetical protein
MKTLQLHSITDFKSDNEYRVQDVANKFALASELNALGFSATVWLDQCNEAPRVYLTDTISINLDYHKQFSIYSDQDYKYIDYYAIKELKTELTEPNGFKVLNAKTIQKWIDYNTSLDTLKLAESVKRVDEVAKKIKEFKALGIEIETKDYHGNDVLRGSIDNDKFMFEFSIDPRTGYCARELKINYKLNTDIETLKELFTK